MTCLSLIADVPTVPAVYALWGGQGRAAYVAYVGLATNLRQRLTQHFVRRDSSVVTRASAVSLNPELITRVEWWECPDFAQQDVLEAAELLAFNALEPALRSRGGVTERARLLYRDGEFRQRMVTLFTGSAAGCLMFPTLWQALERIAELERRVEALEQQGQNP